MTVRLWLGIFWLSKEDVGGGYISQGVDSNDDRLEIIQLLFGSDPAKAPRGINRWGAATEIVRRGSDSNVLVGFMKSSRGKTASEMKRELANEKTSGNYQFEGIFSRTDRLYAVSTTMHFSSPQDFTLHELSQAEQMLSSVWLARRGQLARWRVKPGWHVPAAVDSSSLQET